MARGTVVLVQEGTGIDVTGAPILARVWLHPVAEEKAGTREEELSGSWLPDLLKFRGLPGDKGEDVVEASTPTPHLKALLALPDGVPVLQLARSTVYHRRQRVLMPAREAQKRGSRTAYGDGELTELIRGVLETSRWLCASYRKIWALLRAQGAAAGGPGSCSWRGASQSALPGYPGGLGAATATSVTRTCNASAELPAVHRYSAGVLSMRSFASSPHAHASAGPQRRRRPLTIVSDQPYGH